MRVTFIASGVGAGCALLLLGTVPRAAAQAPPPPASSAASATSADHGAFSGAWKLNADESEKFRDKMRAAHEGEHGGGGGRRGGGGGPGGGMGGGRYGGGRGGGGGWQRGGEEGAGPSDDMRETMRRLDEPAESLTIKQENGEFMIGDETGQIRRLRPDGRTMKSDRGEGETRTRWQANALITETTPARGPRLRETFSLSPDGNKLFVTTHFEPRWGGAVDVRRVYDAAAAR